MKRRNDFRPIEGIEVAQHKVVRLRHWAMFLFVLTLASYLLIAAVL